MEERQEADGCACCKETIAKAQACIRANPGKAALVSGMAGFLFAQLPLRRLLAAAIGLALWLVKPAAILYALFRCAEDCQARRWGAPDGETAAPNGVDAGK